MAKRTWPAALGAGVLVLMIANGSNPGTSKQVGANADDTVRSIAPAIYSTASGGIQIVTGLAGNILGSLSSMLPAPQQQQQQPNDTLPPAQRP